MALTEEMLRDLVISSVKEGNILPITSGCDSHCIFCSHHNNPPEVLIGRIGMRPYEDIVESMNYLSGDQTITIGESATRIVEGEPMLHPQFRDVINELRRRFPKTPIVVTSNGHHLREDMVGFLAAARGIQINLSLNSASLEGRRLLMGDNAEQAETAIDGVMFMKKHGVVFSGSLVAMPNITGYDDLKSTIEYLAHNGADSVSVFAPGFSRFVKQDIFPDRDAIMEELRDFIPRLADDMPCPVLLEPSNVADLKAVCSGIIKGSPAWNAGLRRGDVITAVDKFPPHCRVHAFKMLHTPGKHAVTFERGGGTRTTELECTPEGISGVAMEYDFDDQRALYIKSLISTAPGHVLALCSEFAYNVMLSVMDEFEIPRQVMTVWPTPNLTFGGSIRAAGLLCCGDYIAAFEDYCKAHEKPGAVMLPAESFDYQGRDLTGRSFEELYSAFGVPMVLS